MENFNSGLESLTVDPTTLCDGLQVMLNVSFCQ